MELLIGCGAQRDRRILVEGRADWRKRVTLDFNADHAPDFVHDLNELPYPFGDDTFDELHGYEVLEHLGQQGDFRTLLAQFEEFWRILKPGGYLAATCPHWQSMWAWGDPSHTRIINRGTLAFLDQEEYRSQVGRTPMSDFRFCYKGDLRTVWHQADGETFRFILQAVKG